MSFDKPSGAKAKENLSKKIQAKKNKDKNDKKDPMEEWRDVVNQGSDKADYAREHLRKEANAGREKREKERKEKEKNDPLAIMRKSADYKEYKKPEIEPDEKVVEKNVLDEWREGVEESKDGEKNQGEAMQHLINEQEGKSEKEENQENEKGNEKKKEEPKQGKTQEDETIEWSEKLGRSGAYMATEENQKEKEAKAVQEVADDVLEDLGGKKESPESIEGLKEKHEELFQSLLKLQERKLNKQIECEKAEGVKKTLLDRLRRKKNKRKGEVWNEYNEIQEKYQEAYKKYAENANSYYNALVREKRESLDAEMPEEEKDRTLREFIYGDKGDIKAKETIKEKDGSMKEVEVMKSINQDQLDRIKKIDDEKIRIRSEQNHPGFKQLKKAFKWYSQLPKKYKIAFAIGAGAAIGAGTALAAPGALGLAGILKAGAAAGGIRGVRMAGSMTASGLSGALGRNLAESGRKKRTKKTGEDFLKKSKEGGNVDFVNKLGALYKKNKRRNRIIIGSSIGLTSLAGGTAYALDDIMDYASGVNTTGPMKPPSLFNNDWDLKNAMETEKTGWEKVAENKAVSSDKHSGDWQTYEKTPETETPETGQKMPEVEDEFKVVHDVDNPDEELVEQLTKDDSDETPIIIEDGDKAAEEVMDRFKQKEGFEDGDTVWGKIKENLGTDEKETAKIYSQFKQDMTESLAKEHGMSAEQANKYIEWRMRHLNSFRGIKDTFDFDPDAKEFTVGGFVDDKSIEFFNKLEEVKGGGAAEEVASKAKELGAEDVLKEEGFKEDVLNEKTAEEYAKESVESGEGASQEEIAEMSEDAAVSENLETNLKRLEISEDSNAWKVASGMKLKDLMENVPNDQEQAWAMWRNNEVPLDMQKKLGMINGFYNYGRLIRLSQFIAENNPSTSDLEMIVEEYLKNKA